MFVSELQLRKALSPIFTMPSGMTTELRLPIEMPKLTPELLRVFIRRIEVYEKPEKYSRTCGNPIIIHYAFQLPEQNGIPALENVMRPIQQTA